MSKIKIDRISKEAFEVNQRIVKPEHDVLDRWSFKSDYTIERAFPNAFGRGGAK